MIHEHCVFGHFRPVKIYKLLSSHFASSKISNYGNEYVHVVAPGSSIMSTIPGGKYKRYSGTSMACPQVSGLAALIRTMRPDLNAQKVRKAIESNVRVKSDYANLVSSSGLIDVGKTLKALKSGSGKS